uniref:Lysozyme g n=1 Tax=Salarias fasciatus TaxID=181472 RepID=A0A672FM26_SALFA
WKGPEIAGGFFLSLSLSLSLFLSNTHIFSSEETAQQDKLEYSGVRASEKMAETDLEDMDEYKDKIMKVGGEFKIQPALIAGIISRESRAGKTLQDARSISAKRLESSLTLLKRSNESSRDGAERCS